MLILVIMGIVATSTHLDEFQRACYAHRSTAANKPVFFSIGRGQACGVNSIRVPNNVLEALRRGGENRFTRITRNKTDPIQTISFKANGKEYLLVADRDQRDISIFKRTAQGAEVEARYQVQMAQNTDTNVATGSIIEFLAKHFGLEIQNDAHIPPATLLFDKSGNDTGAQLARPRKKDAA